jgi:adenylate cyclase
LFQDIRLIARIFICLPLWFLGYPDQALHLSEEAIHIADGTGNIQSQGLVSTMAGGLVSLFRKDCYKTRDFAENLFRLSKVNNLQSMKGLAAIFLGRYLTELGRLDEGYASLQEGLVACQAQGLNSMSTLFLAMLAEACSNATDGLRITDEALALARENGERMYLAEIYRIRGELLLTVPGLDGQAESCLRRALLLSRIQGARSLELRAATSLARLYTQQHQSDKAYTILARIFEQFTEGFGTLDLRHAQQLLEELSSTSTYADKR